MLEKKLADEIESKQQQMDTFKAQLGKALDAKVAADRKVEQAIAAEKRALENAARQVEKEKAALEKELADKRKEIEKKAASEANAAAVKRHNAEQSKLEAILDSEREGRKADRAQYESDLAELTRRLAPRLKPRSPRSEPPRTSSRLTSSARATPTRKSPRQRSRWRRMRSPRLWRLRRSWSASSRLSGRLPTRRLPPAAEADKLKANAGRRG